LKHESQHHDKWNLQARSPINDPYTEVGLPAVFRHGKWEFMGFAARWR
jgi:hypothetical protein